MENITKQMQEILDDFSLFGDWEEKYSYLIDLGKKLEGLPESEKILDNKVHGCTSEVWFVSIKKGDKYFFAADSDAFIVKGLITILLKIYSGKTGFEIKDIDIECFFTLLGLKQHLSPNRSNGFFSMVERIRKLSDE